MKAAIKFNFEHYTPAIFAIPAIPVEKNSRLAKIANSEASKARDQNAENSRIAKVAEPFNYEKIIVICYTPAGNPIEVEVTSAEYAEFLHRMNPNPGAEEL